MVPPVSVTAAGLSLFFHVADFAAGRHFAVLADYASASQRGEAQKPNEAHHTISLGASFVPGVEADIAIVSRTNLAVFRSNVRHRDRVLVQMIG
jgi:hypothetical protein